MSHPQGLVKALDRVCALGALGGVIGGVALVAGAVSSVQAALQSYLFAYIFCFNFTLGCFGLLMMHHMVSGGWGFMIQRIIEAGMWTILVMALLFVPILLGVGVLYPWAWPGEVQSVHVWSAYLNVPFFVVRSVIYFSFWICAAFFLSSWSRRQDASGDPRLTRRIRLLCAPGLALYVMTMTFASIDWIMSLEPGWFSSIYGFLFVVNQVLAALALAVIALRFLVSYGPLSDVASEQRFQHLGNMLLTFVILWAYIAYSQYIIIWSADLPDENSWYVRRLGGGWANLCLFVVVVHFFLPFLLLLFRRTKRSLRSLALVALLLIVMRVADTFWLIVPAFSPGVFRVRWLDLVAPVAIGGIWLAAFAWRLKGAPLVPMGDPRFPLPTTAAGGE